MKTLKFITVSILLLFMGCTDPHSTAYRAKVFENMAPPIIVVAVSERVDPYTTKEGKEVNGTYGSIILKDSLNVTVSFTDNELYGNALCASYSVGDTIK